MFSGCEFCIASLQSLHSVPVFLFGLQSFSELEAVSYLGILEEQFIAKRLH